MPASYRLAISRWRNRSLADRKPTLLHWKRFPDRVDPRMARPVLLMDRTSLGRRRKIAMLEAAGVLIGLTIGFLVLAALIALVMRWFE